MSAGFHHSIATRDGLNRAIQASPPHLQVILEAVRDRHIRFGSVKQHTGQFSFPTGLPIVLLLADDYSLSWGPQAFSKPSLRRFLQGSSSAVVVSGAPEVGAYSLAVAGAVVSGRHTLVIESTERWEAEWIALLRELAPGLPTLISTPARGGAVLN